MPHGGTINGYAPGSTQEVQEEVQDQEKRGIEELEAS
jgi:hypothetical protein